MAAQRACVFCGHPNVTNEHAFPLWLRKVVTDRPAQHTTVFLDRHGELREHRQHAAAPFSITVSRVCQDECNGGWMSRLEQDARPFLEPMLSGRGRVLHTEGQKLVATWAYKTALMLNFALPASSRAATAEECHFLYRHREPPPSARVFMFAYGPGAEASASYRGHPLYIGESQIAAIDTGVPPNGYIMTFSVARLGFQVVNTTEPDQAFPLSRLSGEVIHRIHPREYASATWAPKPALSHDQFLALADRFAR
ncbi:MAG: hypothetical protein Q8K82_00980 [Gemmatimonadaceae bacterium]|nr:hypothetical protein [Gemmatimonadaceae bacterium]